MPFGAVGAVGRNRVCRAAEVRQSVVHEPFASGSLQFEHCWEQKVFPGEKRIQNGDILVFIANIEKLYFIMYHFSIYTIKTKINGFFMHFSSRTIVTIICLATFVNTN